MANDLSFNITALDKASQTFIKLAETVELVQKKIERLDGQNATVNVNVKTDDSAKALDSFSTRFKLMAGAITLAAPLAGAAIVAGIGAGFIGVAALAQKSNAQVQTTYKNLWQNVVSDTKAATNQLVPQIVGAGNQISATFTRLGPSINQTFTATAPALVALTRGITELATNAMPGIQSAMQSSLPIFTATADLMGTLGAAFGNAAASVGQNSQAYGGYLTSLGNITSSVLGAVVTIVNDLAQAWSDNGAEIDSAIGGTATAISGLADGVLPVLSAALGAAATVITGITNVLGPLAPILGTVGAAALATWGAFKLAEAVSAGVKALALSVVSMGSAMEVGAAKTATMIAAQKGVAVAASTSAASVKAAGASAATAAVGFAGAAEAIAGPLGIALIAGTALWALFGSSMSSNSATADGLAANLDGVTSALEASNGAITTSVVKSVQSAEGFKEAADSGKEFGVSQDALVNAIIKGGSALDEQRTKLQAIIDAHHEMESTESGDVFKSDNLDADGTRAKKALDALNSLAGGFTKSQEAAAQAQKAVAAHATELTMSNEGQSAATRIAGQFGISLGTVAAGFDNLVRTGGDAAVSVQDVAASFISAQLKILGARDAISSTFKQADNAVVSAKASVSDAGHSFQQSLRGVADAQHGVATAARAMGQAEQGVADAQHGIVTAQRAVGDAIEGVATARTAYARALENDKKAEADLHLARQQAVQDLKDLKLQLEDQVVTEESANVRLFEATQKAAMLGVTPGNVKAVASQDVSYANIDQVKAAIDLRSAQNALNNTFNTGVQLRENVAAADKAGVAGSKGVKSAEDQLRSAHEQVASAAKGVEKAQLQVADANYGLQQANRGLVRAQQAVSDAAYAEQKAHQAVTDAQYQSGRAAAQLEKAKGTLTEAENNASRSLDLSTEAGRRNMTQLLALREQINKQNIPEQQKMNELIGDTATAFGISTQAAQEMLTKLGLIPTDFKFGVTGVASIDSEGLWSSVSVPSTLTGKSKFFAEGGQVTGLGGPRDDKVDARLSPGEWVHPDDSVKFYGPSFMRAVQTKQFPRGGDGAALPVAFADGGMVGANAALAGIGSAYQTKTHAQIVMGLPHGPLLPKYVPPPVGSYSGGANGAIPTGQHLAMIDAALAADGIPRADWPRWEAGMNTLIQRESGWNPGIVNRWDSNAARGTPSGGLTQTIGPTYAAYRNPSLVNNMFDPVSNIAASINYIRRRYGDISQVQQANPNMPPKGYAAGGLVGSKLGKLAYGKFDNGGQLQPGDTLVHNGTGKPENVRTAAAEDALLTEIKRLRNDLLLSRTQKLTGSLVLDSGELLGMIDGQVTRSFHDSELGSGMM